MPGDVVADTFERLSRAFVETMRGLAAPALVSGESPGLRYAGIGGPIAGFNRLMATAMDARTADRVIDAALSRLDQLPVVSAWVPDGARPVDLATRFAARGFAEDDAESVPAMRLELGALPPLDAIPDASWRMATGEADIGPLTDVTVAGFEMPASFGSFIREPYATLLRAGARPVLPVVAELDGRPASVALVSTVGSTAAIYNVATVPEARGRGLGRLVTLAALHEARSRGASVGVLESSAPGYRVYERIGFREVARFRVLYRSREAAG
jgi:ribosomal protein S18 acetylase RimI-like enzyme